MATTKRRLPVLKNTGDEQATEETRPPWQWVGFGSVMIFLAWLPLAYLGTGLVVAAGGPGENAGETTRLTRVLLASLFPLALAALAGGFLVGRFGKPTGVREAILAGALAGFSAVVLTALAGSFSPLFFVVIAIAAGFAGAGGALGVRQRTRSS